MHAAVGGLSVAIVRLAEILVRFSAIAAITVANQVIRFLAINRFQFAGIDNNSQQVTSNFRNQARSTLKLNLCLRIYFDNQ